MPKGVAADPTTNRLRETAAGRSLFAGRALIPAGDNDNAHLRNQRRALHPVRPYGGNPCADGQQ